MATVRAFAARDLPGVAALYARSHPDSRWPSRADCEAYFGEMLCDNPWRELRLPSWVAEEDGRIHGLYAVMPRPMQLRGRALRVAVGCQFMVDPGRQRSLTMLQLAQACLAGPQDLTLADGASEPTRRIWSAIGGTASLLYSLHWTRSLRPARHALSLLERRTGRLLTAMARPLAALADALAARLHLNRCYREATGFVDRELEPAAMLAHLPEFLRGAALQPVYDAHSLAWLLLQAARKLRHGALRARAVHDRGGRLAGWFLYYLQPGGVGEVLQVAARDGEFDQVLVRLLADAWREGAAALRGRVDPRYVQELSDLRCWCRWDSTWTLAHSRDPAVMDAIHRGDAFLSRLEGEWWLRFLGEPGLGRCGASARAAPAASARRPLASVQ